MALTLPSAPMNFYTPSLNELKNVLAAVNGSTKGQYVLLSAAPADIEAAWAEVGAGGNSSNGNNQGTLVIGNKDIEGITGPVQGPEESVGEYGYKLQFDAVDQVPIYIDGSGTTTENVNAIALVEGVDIYANGGNALVRYLLKVDNLLVTDGALINVPALEVIINYSEADI